MNKLFSEFAAVTSQQWKDKLCTDLKGKTFENLISSEGTLPFYHSDTHKHFNPLPITKSWESVQWIDGSDPKKGNQQALEALQNGMTALCISNPQELKTLLQDVLIQHIRIDFENYSKESIQEFEDLVQERGLKPEDVLGAFHGQEKKGNLPNYIYHTVFVDDIYEAIEEGQLISQYVFTIGSDYFKEIAKIRAFFIAFQTIKKTSPFIFAQTSLDNKTTEQPYNNLLRTTTESMSAIFGGCDALMIRPYNQSFEEVTDFSNRLARNQQHILREESFLEKVQDPSAGSYFIEALTQSFLKS